jgi:hypothetical protein
VSLSAPALKHSVSTTFIEYMGGGGGGGATTPAVQLNSIFSAKTDPRENPEKNPAMEMQTRSHIIWNDYYYFA